MAKKGIWVSEYRIESGLNCGGHAFATDGYLMGPILKQFKENRDELIETVHELLIRALSQKERSVPETRLPLKITAQGGVGTIEEHQFILDHYKVDSVGWGTPFLLVPEATTVDDATRNDLIDAKEDDLHISYGGGFRIALNQNFIIAIDYGIAGDEQDGNSGMYIGLGYLY